MPNELKTIDECEIVVNHTIGNIKKSIDSYPIRDKRLFMWRFFVVAITFTNGVITRGHQAVTIATQPFISFADQMRKIIESNDE